MHFQAIVKEMQLINST